MAIPIATAFFLCIWSVLSSSTSDQCTAGDLSCTVSPDTSALLQSRVQVASDTAEESRKGKWPSWDDVADVGNSVVDTASDGYDSAKTVVETGLDEGKKLAEETIDEASKVVEESVSQAIATTETALVEATSAVTKWTDTAWKDAQHSVQQEVDKAVKEAEALADEIAKFGPSCLNVKQLLMGIMSV